MAAIKSLALLVIFGSVNLISLNLVQASGETVLLDFTLENCAPAPRWRR